jgi:hypothetical protein
MISQFIQPTVAKHLAKLRLTKTKYTQASTIVLVLCCCLIEHSLWTFTFTPLLGMLVSVVRARSSVG